VLKVRLVFAESSQQDNDYERLLLMLAEYMPDVRNLNKMMAEGNNQCIREDIYEDIMDEVV